jgi:hypothetical protein
MKLPRLKPAPRQSRSVAPGELADDSRAFNPRAGELVRVRRAREIPPLDERGMLDSLSFMPEMCCSFGRTLSVDKRGDKTCGGYGWGVRRMTDVVHLSSVRGYGAAQGGCRAACLIYWKEASLERIQLGSARDVTTARSLDEEAFSTTTLLPATTNGRPPSRDEEAWLCQATEVAQSSTHLQAWRLGPYGMSVRNRGIAKLLRSCEAFNRLQDLNRRFLSRLRLFKERRTYPFISIHPSSREVWFERLCSAPTLTACRPTRPGLL